MSKKKPTARVVAACDAWFATGPIASMVEAVVRDDMRSLGIEPTKQEVDALLWQLDALAERADAVAKASREWAAAIREQEKPAPKRKRRSA